MMKFILFSLLVCFTIIGCNTDFESINTNPNAPVEVQPGLLLRQVIYNYGEEMSYEGYVAGNLLGQYLTALDFNLFDRHALNSPQLGGNPWPVFYRNLRDNQLIIEQSRQNETFAVYEGPALIFKAYITMALTDLYGDVPYREGFSGNNGTTTPAYDDQESIYLGENGILDHLKTGILSIQQYSGAVGLEGDLLFNGDLDAWIRFANSLQIKALMRISNKTDVTNDLQALFTEGNYINSNSENAVFNFTGGEPNNFRMARLRAGDFNNFVLSETMEDVLSSLNDPRISVLFRPFANSNGTAYNGLVNGIDASQTAISLSDYSLGGTIFRENTGQLKANYLTAWETHFLLAEAAHRGLISADAQSLYESGVLLAFEYWNTALPADYLTGPAAFDTGQNGPIEQIITQKWIANMINGYEGWIEYRRTGYPALRPVSASLNNGLIPIRMPYPAEESTLNAEHYDDAAAATDGNSINYPVWWDQ